MPKIVVHHKKKLSEFIEILKSAKKEIGGDPEIIFSQDEEGNGFLRGCFLGGVGDKICIFPCGEYFQD